MQHWELILFFGLISFIYSSVGFGGASSYLALLAVYALPVYEMKLIALLCNIVVVTGGSLLFFSKGQLNFKKILPLVALSIPMAYLGGKIKLGVDTFFVLLGVSLIVAALLLVIKTKDAEKIDQDARPGYIKNGAIGGAIGLLSGMVGIGGGIFLSPVLHLTRWDVPKKIAATASLFILVNSVSGIAGHLQQPHGDIDFLRVGLLCAAVLVGGQMGSRIGINKFSPVTIRRVTAVLVFAAGVEVLKNHLHLP